MSASRPRTALVLGGGIVGLSTALAMQERGLAVNVLDAPGPRPSASWGNAGHIATEQHEPLASWATIRSLPRRLTLCGGPVGLPLAAVADWLPFGLRLMRAARPEIYARGRVALGALLAQALPAWRRILSTAGVPGLLREDGHMVAWESAAGARRGRAALASFESPVVRWRDAAAAEMACLAGTLKRPPADAVRFEGTASVVDPGAVLDGLRSAILRGGGTIEARAGRLAEARRSGADLIVVAAGVRSGVLMGEVGSPVPLIAERGYHIQSAQTAWPEALPPVVFEDRALVVTRFRSGLRATSFVEFAAADAPPDPSRWDRLRQHAAALGLPFDSPPETWFGCRPILPDYLPAIGRSRRDPRILYAFGHQHLGLTLGPISGDILAALACGEPPPVPIDAFAVERFD